MQPFDEDRFSFPEESYQKEIERLKEILEALGITESHLPQKELDIGKTARRVLKWWWEMTRGLSTSPPKVTVFELEYEHDQILLTKDIDFVSVCSHHLAPFRGKACVAYIPDKLVCGLSKPARVLDWFAARPQTQELLTKQVAEYLFEKLHPKGVAVVLEAEHTCVQCRGARKPNAKFVTSKLLGVFAKDSAAREEVLRLMRPT